MVKHSLPHVVNEAAWLDLNCVRFVEAEGLSYAWWGKSSLLLHLMIEVVIVWHVLVA